LFRPKGFLKFIARYTKKLLGLGLSLPLFDVLKTGAGTSPAPTSLLN